MSKEKSKQEKPYYLTPEEGRALCEKARKAVECCKGKFPKVEEMKKRRENDPFHQWVMKRIAELDKESNS